MDCRPNIAVITLDSLRYDSTQLANTPTIAGLMRDYQRDPKGWQKVGAHATYTLPAHISIFQAGIFPCNNRAAFPPLYNRKRLDIFKAKLNWNRDSNALYPTPEADNIVKGLRQIGYRTVGIGGVHWFDTRYVTSGNLWRSFFDEFFWRPEFGEETPNGWELQIEFVQALLANHDERPLFFFMNVSATHSPFRGLGTSVAAQSQCLEYFDAHLPKLLACLPKPLHLILLADHGECFGEDGLWGHGFYHPKVMEVPMTIFEIGFDVSSLPTWKENSGDPDY